MRKSKQLIKNSALLMTGSQTCLSTWQNLLSSENELAKDLPEALVLTKKSSTPTYTLIMLRALLFTPTPLFAPTFAISMARHNDKNL